MGRSTAGDVTEPFLEGIKELDKLNLLQVSSDRQNFNLSFLKNLSKLRKEKVLNLVINIVTCGHESCSMNAGAKGSAWESQKAF